METAKPLEKRSGVLYSLMLIAAIAVTVFSIAGIATLLGWLPSASSKSPSPAAATERSGGDEAYPAAKRPRRAAVACRDCGVIESIRAVEVRGEGSGLGAVAGGVVGGILGNQVGGGSGRVAMTVVGAGAGAYAGNEIEKNLKRSARYQIRVRMDDGSSRTFYEAAPPGYAIGQKVRVTAQGIVAAG